VTLLLGQLVLAAVFAVAGLAKFADRDGVRQVAAEFGAPSAVLAPMVWLVVIAELGVALAMIVSPWAHIGALVALALLATFSAAVLVNLVRGRRPSCHCFGRLHAAPVGGSTVARNVLLASVAGFVAADGRFPIAFAALAFAGAAGWALLEHRRGPRARPGVRAASFALEDEAGRTRTLEALLAPRTPLLLVFSAPGCGACAMLMGDLARWQSDLDGRLTVAIVSAGSREEHLAPAREHGLRLLLADAGSAVSEAYGVQATPTAVLIDADATVDAAPAVGVDAIAALVSAAAETGADTTLARRGLLVRAVGGAAAVTVLPMIASATAAARTVHRAVRPEAMKIDGAWLCDQRYALCTSAKCVPSKDDPKISVCRCKIARGYSVGFKNCQARAPKGNRLHSNFSLQDVNAKTRVMTCSAEGLWAQCLDVACRVEADHPRHAKCQCVNMRTDEFLTFGGDCDTATCATAIWSATTKPFPGGAQYEKGIKLVGLDLTLPKNCPSPKERAH
jgi:peroxiredoxin